MKNPSSAIPFRALCALSWLFFPCSVHAAEAPKSRIAVMSSEETRAMGDLLTVELSKAPGIEVVERDEIRRLVEEKNLTEALGKGDYRQVGRWLNAAGLVILDRVSVRDATNTIARLVAVDAGVVLGVVPVSAVEGDAKAQAGLLAKRLVQLLPKLQIANEGRGVPVSVLGLRFELDLPDAAQVERQVNMLLCSRLAAEEDMLLLERWRLQDVAWEKLMGSDAARQFWTGGYLVDGHIAQKGKDLELKIRLRLPGKTEPQWILKSGAANGLAALTEGVSGEILARKGQKTVERSWDRVAEAKEFVLMGKWAFLHGLRSDAIDALETAIALDYKGRAGIMSLIMAYLDRDQALWGRISQTNPRRLSVDAIGAALDAARRLNDLCILSDADPRSNESREPSGISMEGLPRYWETVMFVIENISKVMAVSYRTGYARSHIEELRDLRTKCRNNYDRCREADSHFSDFGFSSRIVLGGFDYMLSRGDYVPLLQETPNDMIATYRQRRYNERQWIGARIRPPFLDASDAAAMASEELPWIIAWDPRDEGKLLPTWRGFIEDLLASTNSQDRADGLLFKCCSLSRIESRAKMMPDIRRFLSGLQEEARILSDNQCPVYLDGLITALTKFNADSQSQAMDADAYARHALSEARLVCSNALATAESLSEWRNRYAALVPSYLDKVRQKTGQPMDERWEKMSGPRRVLDVRRFVNLESEKSAGDRDRHHSESATYAEGRVWLADGSRRTLFGLDLQSGDVMRLEWPKKEVPASAENEVYCTGIHITPEHIVVVENVRVWIYDRKPRAWRLLDLPVARYRGRFIDGALYLGFTAGAEASKTQPSSSLLSGSGLFRVNCTNGLSELLVSSRRNPPESSIDGRNFGSPVAVFEGRNGKISMATDNLFLYEAKKADKSWTRWGSGNDRGLTFVPGNDGAVGYHGDGGIRYPEREVEDFRVFGGFREIFLISRTSEKMELLLNNPDLTVSIRSVLKGATPKWSCPSLVSQERLYGSFGVLESLPIRFSSTEPLVAFEEGCLWLVAYANKDWILKSYGQKLPDTLFLYAFVTGAKDPAIIPLRFCRQEGEPGKTKDSSIEIHRVGRMLWTPDGLVFVRRNVLGCWYLPFSDLDELRSISNAPPWIASVLSAPGHAPKPAGKAEGPPKKGADKLIAGAIVPAETQAVACFTNSLGMEFVPVPGTSALFCKWETRVKDFEVFVRNTGHDATRAVAALVDDRYQRDSRYTWQAPGFLQGLGYPVCGLNWYDARAFCAWLTVEEHQGGRIGKELCYRLPTDAEWSTAVGLGLEPGNTPEEKDQVVTNVYPWGSGWPPPDGTANYAGEGTKSSVIIGRYQDGYPGTAPVGSYKANNHGLYDMGGNVWEWCLDLYTPDAPSRVLRGGSWLNCDDWAALSSCRFACDPRDRGINYGFRCVLGVPVEPAQPVKTAAPKPAVMDAERSETSVEDISEEDRARKKTEDFLDGVSNEKP